MIPDASFIDNVIECKSTLYCLVYCKTFSYQHVKIAEVSVMCSVKGKILLVLRREQLQLIKMAVQNYAVSGKNTYFQPSMQNYHKNHQADTIQILNR